MKRKLALFMVLAMLVSLVPMNVFAASTLTVSKTISVADDAKLTLSNAPRLKIEENAINEFGTTSQTILVTLSSNAEWLICNSGADAAAGEYNAGDAATVQTEVYAMTQEQSLLSTTAGDVTFKRNSDQEAEISFKFAAVGTTVTGKRTVYIPLVAKMTGTGEVKATVDGRDSSVTSGSVVFANAASGGTKTTVASVKSFADTVTLDTVKIDEVQLGAMSFPTAQKVKLSLPSGFEWNNSTLTEAGLGISYSGDFKTNSAALVPASCSVDGKDLYLVFNAASKSGVNRGTINLTNLKVKSTNDAKYGDVTMSVKPQNGADFTEETITVGTYSEYGVTIESVATTVPTIYSGEGFEVTTTAATDFTNEGNCKVAKLRIKETVENALITDRKLHVEFPDGVKVLGYEFKKHDNVTGYTNETANALTAGDTSYFEKNRSWFDITGLSVTAGKKADIELQIYVSVRADFVGDIKATVNGAALAGKTAEVVLGKAVAPAAYTVVSKDFKLGLQNQPVGDIVITEPAKGNWDSKSDGTVAVTVTLPGGFDWNTDPTVKVTKGDITLKTDGIKTAGSVLTIPVKYASITAPAELTISGGTIDLARTAAEGDYKVAVGGNAFIKNYDADSANGEFDKNNVPKVVFGRIITPADQNTKTIQKVVFTIGAKEYKVGDTAVTSDVAPYINEQGRTMLPLRALASALNVAADNIVWSDADRSVVIFKGESTVKVIIGQAQFTKNGTVIPMDTQAVIVDGRTMMPLRAVAQALGANITWDEATKTVTVQ